MRRNLNKAASRKAGAFPGGRIIRDARPKNPKSGLVQGSGPSKIQAAIKGAGAVSSRPNKTPGISPVFNSGRGSQGNKPTSGGAVRSQAMPNPNRKRTPF